MVSLAEAPKGLPTPASSLYLALGCSMENYRLVSGVGERMGWLKVTSETLALTHKGLVQARELQALGI